jgi:molybdopterin-binding protein/molybdate transport repressor ModE-like protein
MRSVSREQVLTPSDVALLATLSQEPNLVQACRQLGMSRDRGMYRLRRMGRAIGAPVVRTARGGVHAGRTQLTPQGRALLRRGVAPLRRGGPSEQRGARVLEGTWTAGPEPSVLLRGGLRLRVSFAAAPGSRVVVAVDPESILVARRTFPTSARNVLRGEVEGIEAGAPNRWTLTVRARGALFDAAVTPASVRALHLRPGVPVVLYLKATAIRPLAVTPP